MSDVKVENDINMQGDTITPSCGCVIRVIGVGGGGNNALQYMMDKNLAGVECMAINTDPQTLERTNVKLKVQIGVRTTNGLGAGCDPNKGRKAAEESYEDIKKLLSGSDMVFITAGMGGGTGTGASPIVAKVAKEVGVLTVAIVTQPFSFEGKRHRINAMAGISELAKNVDSIIIVDNDKLLRNLGPNVSLKNAFEKANDVLYQAVEGITSAITNTGFINLDFADIVTVMRNSGLAMIGSSEGQGPNLVEDTVRKAINSPLVDNVNLGSATGLIANIRVSQNIPVNLLSEVCDAIQAYAREDATCKFGLYFDDKLDDGKIVATVLVTGISSTDIDLPSNQAINRLNPANN